MRGRRRVAKNNVVLALGNLDDGRVEGIVDASVGELAKVVVEVLKMGRNSDVMRSVEVKGLENLEPFRGKGGIALSLHLGNFPLMCLYLGRFGFNIVPIIRKFHHSKLAQFVDALIRSCGMRVIYNRPKQKATMEIIRTLKKGGFPFFAADQTAPGWDVKVPFFGVPVPTFRGPVIIHRRTGASIIPMYTYRDGDRHVVVIEEPLDDKLKGDLERDLAVINAWMEGVIRKHPESWFWFHRRWKRAKKGGKDGIEDKDQRKEG